MIQQTDIIDTRAQQGAAAEQLAADYVQEKGLKVLARNLRCKSGELDLVCLDGALLAIIEVRQRGRDEFGGALASITWRKQRKIIRATRYFVQQHLEWQALLQRFDVIAVEGLPTGHHQIIWIKDAFRA